MQEEYSAFLVERGLREEDVEPMLKDRSVLSKPDVVASIAKLFLSLKNVKTQAELDQVQSFVECVHGNTNSLIRTLDKNLIKMAEDAGIVFPNGILSVGVYPLNSFNARAVARKNGVLILLDSGLFEFISFYVSLLMTEDVPISERGRLYSDAISAYQESGELPDPTQYDPPSRSNRQTLISHITNWAEWFVLCHEYAHHALGHLSEGNQQAFASSDGQIDAITYDHQREHDADLWSLTMLLQIANGRDDRESARMLACAAPFFFLSTCALLELADGHNRDSDTHPSSIDRIWIMEHFLRTSPYKDECQLWWKLDELMNNASRQISGADLPIPVYSAELDKVLRAAIANVGAK
jgi:hypothetical protein